MRRAMGRVRCTDVTARIAKFEGVQVYENPSSGIPEVAFRQVLDALTEVVYEKDAATIKVSSTELEDEETPQVHSPRLASPLR